MSYNKSQFKRMRFNPENIIGKNSYPGKRSEDLSEKKEKKEHDFNNTESFSDVNDITRAQAQDPVHPENRYNYPEAEESYESGKKPFVAAEDVSDDGAGEDKIIEHIDERLAAEMAEIEEIEELRDCGFFNIIDKLLKTVDRSRNDHEKENILNRLQSFIVEYKAILNSNLPVDKEEKKIEQSFNESFGKIAYGPDGSAELVNELMTVIKNAPKNRWRGEKVAQSEVKAAPSKTAKFTVEKKTAPEKKLEVKKGGDKWPGTNIFRKIKINW